MITSGVGIQAEADLADMSTLAPFNDQFKFVLVHIDIFSKYVRTVNLKSKTAQEVTSAFKKIFADGGKTQKIRTDRGGEFVNVRTKGIYDSSYRPNSGGIKEHYSQIQWPVPSINAELVEVFPGE